MQAKTRGIVLGYIKYSDSSIILKLYTENFGRQTFIVNGIKGKKAKFRLNLFQPLYLLSLDVDIKPGRELQRIRDIKNEVPFQSLPYDIVKSTQAMFLAEMLSKTLIEEEQNQELFDFIYHAVAFFDTLEHGKANFHILFLLHLTRYLGFFPHNNYKDKYCFDLLGGNFIPNDQSVLYSMDVNTSKQFYELIRCPLHEVSRLKIASGSREGTLNLIIKYYSLHIESVKDIRSLPVLHDIFR